MLRATIEQCSDDVWKDAAGKVAFWQIAYHALFFTHYYLQPDEHNFEAWEHHREGYESFGSPSGQSGAGPQIDQPYTKAELLDYCHVLDGLIDTSVDALDLASPESGFHWYGISKLDHQLVNLRHIQHHVGGLNARLRAAGLESVEWEA